MEFLSNLKWSNVLKGAVVALIAIVLIALGFSIITSTFKQSHSVQFAPSGIGMGAYDSGYDYDESADYKLSTRNVVGEAEPVPPGEPSPVVGDDAEDFEVTEYSASIETRQLEQDCDAIAGLKVHDYVVFENANEYDRGCSYSFKVKSDNVDEILAVVMGLNPRDFNENTFTIKQTIEDFTSEEEILLKKLETIDDTLEQATASYDELTELATRVQDVESLATIINSKINIIERLTQERINISARLENLQRAKAAQLDRLEYTYFYVSIYENRFVDWKQIKDSWKSAVQDFVWDINSIIRGISLDLVSGLLRTAQIALYLFILLVVVKYGWKAAKWMWRK